MAMHHNRLLLLLLGLSLITVGFMHRAHDDNTVDLKYYCFPFMLEAVFLSFFFVQNEFF